MEDALRQALAAADEAATGAALDALGSPPAPAASDSGGGGAVAAATDPAVFAFKWKVGGALRRVFDAALDGEQLTPTVLDRYLALAQLLVRRELAHPALPLQVFADLFEARPLGECKRYWGILEQKSASLLPVAELRGNNRSELLLLQLSNALLARTSKVMDTDFAGRIHVFLARLLPLEHKASLNLGSNFHTENVTAFEPATDNDKAAFGATRDLLVGASAAAAASSAPIDFATYETFWTLQKALANPKQVLASPASWALFRKQAEAAVRLFETHKAAKGGSGGSGSSSSSSSKGGSGGGSSGSGSGGGGVDGDGGAKRTGKKGRKHGDEAAGPAVGSTDVAQGGFGVKYLTKKSLLTLQLRDPQVQRQVLFQVLIIAEYIGRYHGTVRGASRAVKDPKEDLRDIVKRAESVLKQVPPSGRKFVKFVRALFEREQFWTEWKAKKCPPLHKGAFALPAGFAPTLGFLRPVSSHQPGELFSGSSTLPDQNPMDLCRRDIAKPPPLAVVLKRVRDANDPDNCIEDEFHPRRLPVYCWRGMRSLLGKHLDLFDTHFQHLEDAVWQLDNPDGKKEDAPTAVRRAEQEAEAAAATKAAAEKKAAEEKELRAAKAAAKAKAAADKAEKATKDEADKSKSAAQEKEEEEEKAAEPTAEKKDDTKKAAPTPVKRKAGDAAALQSGSGGSKGGEEKEAAAKKKARNAEDEK